MTTKTVLFIILGIISFGVSLLAKKNKEKSDAIDKRMLARKKQVKNIEIFKNSEDFLHPIANSIITLLENFNEHEEIGRKLNTQEIKKVEAKLGLKLPKSYKIFLKYFGDGGSWVFNQNIDTIKNYSWLKDYREDLSEVIQLENKIINVDSLLCLMTEDSNGGAWCWLTSEKHNNGEWQLAYYMNNQLHYKVLNLTQWLKVLTETKYEVIRALDTEEKLGLG
jgi:hypothetical protein